MDPATLAAAGPDVRQALQSHQGLVRPRGSERQLMQLTRLTASCEEAAAAAQLLTHSSPITSSYDILAVRPLSERVFQQV